MADHRCPACGAGVPRGAGFCPACGTAVNAPELPIEQIGPGTAVTEHEVALGANRPNPRRSALVVGIALVALLGGGLVIGAGSGEGDEQGTSPTPSTTAAAPSTTAARTRPDRAPRRTTTTTIPAFAVDPMPELAGLPLYAIVDDRVVRIDSATGQIAVLAGGSRAATQDYSTLMAVAGGVIVRDERARFVPDDGSEPIAIESFDLWPAADPALIWADNYDAPEREIRLIRLVTGEMVGSVPVPRFAYPIGDDGSGRLLVIAQTGGTFVLDPSSGAVERFSDAQVVDVTATHLVQLRCDDTLACGYELVDRATGLASPVDVGQNDAFVEIALDPTGVSATVLEYGEFGPVLTFVDLASGTVTELASAAAAEFQGRFQGPSWTPNGEHLILTERGSIAVWSVASDEPTLYRVTDGNGDVGIVTATALGP